MAMARLRERHASHEKQAIGRSSKANRPPFCTSAELTDRLSFAAFGSIPATMLAFCRSCSCTGLASPGHERRIALRPHCPSLLDPWRRHTPRRRIPDLSAARLAEMIRSTHAVSSRLSVPGANAQSEPFDQLTKLPRVRQPLSITCGLPRASSNWGHATLDSCD